MCPITARGTESFLEFKYERISDDHLLHNSAEYPKYMRAWRNHRGVLFARLQAGTPTSVSRNVQKMTQWRAEKLHSALDWVSV